MVKCPTLTDQMFRKLPNLEILDCSHNPQLTLRFESDPASAVNSAAKAANLASDSGQDPAPDIVALGRLRGITFNGCYAIDDWVLDLPSICPDMVFNN